MVLSALLIILTVGLAGLIIAGRKKYKDYKTGASKEFKLTFLHPALFIILDRFPKLTQLFGESLMNKLIQVFGEQDLADTIRAFLAEVAGTFLLILEFFLFLSVLQNSDLGTFFVGIILGTFVVYYHIQSLDKRIKEKKEEIESDLPDFIDKLVLYVNAGESLQQALIHIVKAEKAQRQLYQRLRTLVAEIEYGNSFTNALDEFTKLCKVQQVTMFSTSVLLNYKRGGDELTTSLRAISRDIWQNKKMLARTKAEEASSKLVGPMMLIFLAVAGIVVTPVLLMMK